MNLRSELSLKEGENKYVTMRTISRISRSKLNISFDLEYRSEYNYRKRIRCEFPISHCHRSQFFESDDP